MSPSNNDYDGAPWRDEETLRRLYVDEGLSKRAISDQLGCSDTTIANWLERHDIAARSSRSESAPWRDDSVLRELYVDEGLSTDEVADRLGCSRSTVAYWLDKHGIETRERHEKMVEKLYKKPAYFYTSKKGYETWAAGLQGDVNEVLVHRLLAVSEFGFRAVCGQDVHHKNHVPWDNRPENLELLSRSDHVKQHWEGEYDYR